MSLRPASASDLLIDGKLIPGSGGVFDVVNPATEEVIGQAADATVDDMDAAIAAAKADTRNTWIDLTPEEVAGFSQALAPITDAYVK